MAQPNGSPLEFDLLLGDRIEYVHGDKSKITSTNSDYARSNPMEDIFTGYPCTAICNSSVMSSGKHYATFTLTGSHRLFYSFIGIVRPMSPGAELDKLPWGACFFWNEDEFELFHDVVSVKDADERAESKNNVDYCSFYTLEGDCKWADFRSYLSDNPKDLINKTEEGRLEGTMRDASMDGEFGMLLDLDEGTLSVYKNGRRLGVLKDGLRGEYCWTATVMAQYVGNGDQQNVRIQSAPVPTS